MSQLSLKSMRDFLSQSISSWNQNKLNGLMAEVDFRNHLSNLGFSDRVSAGGWIFRNTGSGKFGHATVVAFPESILPGHAYETSRALPNPDAGLHTICSTFHQLGIHSYFCAPTVSVANDPASVKWHAIQLGVPTARSYEPFPENIADFQSRGRRYNYLRHKSDVSNIPAASVPEEFSKEHLRISFGNMLMSEISDIDGIFWGNRFTYPIEIKEKTSANDARVGDYFGLDVGPFVKLAFYAAKQGNLHSIFIVREINNPVDRQIVNWWYIKFEHLAQYASWVSSGGGKGMSGGNSAVVKIPKAEFSLLDATALSSL